MYEASDLRKGLKIELDGDPYVVTDFDFHKPGKGQANYRCKLKNLRTGSTTDKTFRSSDRINKPDLFDKQMVYAYPESNTFVFMDPNTYDQVPVPEDLLGERKYLLNEDMTCTITLYENEPVEITLPNFVEKKIAKTEPGVRGDTATNVTKPAYLDNGYEVHVPLFLNEGDIIRIDTRTGEYRERVKKG